MVLTKTRLPTRTNDLQSLLRQRGVAAVGLAGESPGAVDDSLWHAQPLLAAHWCCHTFTRAAADDALFNIHHITLHYITMPPQRGESL